MPTTSFATDQADGLVESNGFSGPAGTVMRAPLGIGPVVAGRGISVYHSGDAAPPTATTGTDTTPVVTETYFVRVYIQNNNTLTGISLLNGSLVAGNVIAGLYDGSGALVAQTASTAQAGAAGYQQIPFTAPYLARGPQIHFVAVQFNNTGARFRSHALGNFTTFKTTGTTYGTLPPTYVNPNSFTANVGAILDTY
jgi:hypothetical protein